MLRASWALPTIILALAASVVSADDQIRWQPNVETAQRVAAQTNRLILVHCWAPWCKACVQLDKEVFARPEIGRALEANFVPVKLNVDDAPATARMYGVASLPTDVILTPTGRFVAQSPCLPTANQYLSQLNRLADGHRQLVQNQQVAQTPSAPPTAVAAAATGAVASPAAASPPAAAVPAQSALSDDRYAQYFKERPGQTPVADPQLPPQAQTWRPEQTGPQVSPAVPPVGAIGVTPGADASRLAGPAQPPVVYPPSVQPPVPQQPALGQQPPVAQQPPVQQMAGSTTVQLPPGNPPLALDGYCAAALTEQRRWIPGDRRWGVIHRGRTYLFSGPEEQKRFLVNPDAYSPVISGNDPVLALDSRQEAAGKREHGVFFNNRIYLFSSEQTLEAFNKNPNRYSAEIIQAMR